jgi:hypothetical protein
MAKSGAACVHGHRILSPPARNPIWLIRVTYSGKSCVSRSVGKKVLMIESMFDVSGPFNLPKEGLGVWLASGREHWKRGDEVIFEWCTEKRGGGVEMLSSNEVIFFLTSAIQQSKNSDAKLADPIGCPSVELLFPVQQNLTDQGLHVPTLIPVDE